jgi:hypothetical protein
MAELNVFYRVQEHILQHTSNREAPTVIYTGIGTAAGLLNNEGVLEAANYHQYPPFVQELKQLYADAGLQLYIILIDPRQEEPPYHVKHDPLVEYVTDGSSSINTSKSYHSLDDTTHIYVWRAAVGTIVDREPVDDADEQQRLDLRPDQVDITSDLEALNAFAIEQGICTLYHDFTGRRNNLLAEYFDPALQGHLDHIIYGFSARQDHGCYFNLLDEGCFLASKLVKNSIVLFNYFQYAHDDRLLDQEATAASASAATTAATFPAYMQSRIKNQATLIIDGVLALLRNHGFSVLRLAHGWLTGQNDPAEVVNFYFCRQLAPTMHRLFRQRFAAGQFAQLFDDLVHYYAQRLAIVVQLKHLDLTAIEIMTFVVEGEPEPYRWYDALKGLVGE